MRSIAHAISLAVAVQACVAYTATWQELYHTAELCASSNHYAAAYDLYAQAAQLVRDEAGTNTTDEADCLAQMAELRSLQGNYADAVMLRRHALALREAACGSTHPEVATALNNLAMECMRLGTYNEAAALFTRALDIREQVCATNDPALANSLNNLATLYGRLGRYADAEQLLSRALAIRLAALGNNDPRTVESRNNLAALLHVQRKYDQSEPLFYAAFDTLRANAQPDPRMLAAALNNLGTVNMYLGNYDDAVLYHTQALTMRESTCGTNHPDVAQSLDNLGRAQTAQQRWNDAEHTLQQALRMRETLLGAVHPDTARTLRNLGRLYAAQDRPEEALTYYTRALAARQQTLGETHVETAESCADIADVYLAQGRHREVIEQYEHAVTMLEASRTTAGGECYAEGVRHDQRAWCNGLVESLACLDAAEQDSHVTGVFVATEIAREREFLDQVLAASAIRNAGVPPRDAARDTDLRVRVLEREDALRRELRKPAAQRDDQLLEQLDATARAAREDYAAVQTALFTTYPRYAALRTARPLDVPALRTDTLAPDEAIIAYWEADQCIGAFVITHHACVFIPLVRDATECTRQLAQLQAIVEYALADVEVYKRTAFALYNTLLAPCLARLADEQIAKVYVIPHDRTVFVPFEALTVTTNGATFGELDYVFNHVSITYVPSVMVLQIIRADAATRTQLQPAQHPMFLMGDPWYGDTNATGVARLRNIQHLRKAGGAPGQLMLPPLPGTRREVERIAALFYGSASDTTHVLLGSAARESALKHLSASDTLRTYRYVHISAHALLPDRYRQITEPCLAFARGDTTDDGLLSANEILTLRLNADMVTLSACRSGTIDESDTARHGIATLAHAFFLAGASRLIVSHWNVDDTGATEFMTTFYTALARTPAASPAAALRATRQSLLRHPRYAHPFYWAAFTLMGDGR